MSTSIQQLSFTFSETPPDIETEKLTFRQKICLVLAKAIERLARKIENTWVELSCKFPFLDEEPIVPFLTPLVACGALLCLFILCGEWSGMDRELEVKISLWLCLLFTIIVGFITISSVGLISDIYANLCKKYHISDSVDFENEKEKIFEQVYDTSSYHIRGIRMFIMNLQNKDDWAKKLLEILSLGKSSVDVEPMSTYEKQLKSAAKIDESKEIIKNMKTEYAPVIKEIRELIELWEEALGELLVFEIPSSKNSEQLYRIADRFDVDIMLDAYYAGVPVADIVA